MSKLPVLLDTEEFKEAWALWCQHRKEIKKKLVTTQVKVN